MSWSRYDANGDLKVTAVPAVGVMTMLNVKDYGATGDGTTNDQAAIQAAINAAGALGVSARGVDVYFPAGVYAYGSVITCPFNNVMLRGAGWQSTVLLATFTTGDMLQFGNGTTHNGCGLMNMSVWCNAARTTGANININLMNDCLIQNFVVNNYFQGILIQGASLKVWVDQGEINAGHPADGVGIQVTNGLGGDTYIKDIVMSNTPASKPAVGIQVTQAGHISIIRCNVTSCVKGLHVNPAASQDVSYMFIDHSMFDSCGTHGAHFNPAGAATARCRSVMAVNSWFSGSTTTGATSSGIEFTITSSAICDALSFIGCRILNNQRHGVLINAGPTNISFTDCTISGNSTETTTTYDGVSIAANVTGIQFMNCKIGQAGTAANTQRYAINIAAGTSGNIQIVNNDCQPNNTVGTHGYINIGALTGGNINICGNTPQLDGGMGSTTVAASGSITTTETVISAAFRMGANALRPGTVITIRGAGSCVVATAAAVPGLFRVKMGTAGTTADGVIMTFTLPTSGGVGTVAFNFEIQLVCRTAGGSGTFAGSMEIHNGSATLGLILGLALALAGTAAAGSTITNNYLTLQFGSSGSANVACTFQIVSITVDVP
jgi:hypothetical protein